MIFKDQEEPLISSKNSFYFGFVCGVALISVLGFIIVNSPSFKNQQGRADEVVNNNGVVANNKVVANKPAVVADNNPTNPIDIKVVSSDHIRGEKNAPVTIIEYSDYQCPYCSRFHDTMKQVMQAYPKQVRWIFRHFPLSFHPFAKKAAMAAECANDQNKFWEYTDAIYANQNNLSDAMISQTATDLGLNADKFESCLSSNKYAAKVDADLAQGQKYGVQGTPGGFINGTTIPGAVPFSQIDTMIKAALNK